MTKTIFTKSYNFARVAPSLKRVSHTVLTDWVICLLLEWTHVWAIFLNRANFKVWGYLDVYCHENYTSMIPPDWLRWSHVIQYRCGCNCKFGYFWGYMYFEDTLYYMCKRVLCSYCRCGSSYHHSIIVLSKVLKVATAVLFNMSPTWLVRGIRMCLLFTMCHLQMSICLKNMLSLCQYTFWTPHCHTLLELQTFKFEPFSNFIKLSLTVW